MKAFTLVELIAIIIILGIIAIIAIPSIGSMFEKQKEQEYQKFLNNLYIIAESYIVVNDEKHANLENGVEVTIEEIKNEGFINQVIINPKTEQEILLTDTILITKTDGIYSFEYKGE